ncbi:MAG: hypothetical protein ACXQTK_05635 [Candidatus Syntropharchaeales archaeon]
MEEDDLSIWKICPEGPVKVAETKFAEEKLLEENLEAWVIADPALLGEPLLIIGRQVLIPDVKDRLDILALDPQGNTVIIELKRGKLKDPVDMQALRYASYISKWRFEDFENQARAFLGKVGDLDFNFNELYEEFCIETGIDEVPDINVDQRLIVVGSEVREKLGSVALWLRDHNVDIKVIEIELYREGEAIFVQPHVIIPLPVSRFTDTGRAPRVEGSQPWLIDGKRWHLEKRCSPKTRDTLLKLDDIIRDNFDLDGPRWNQKLYVSYRVSNYNWLVINTHSSILVLQFLVKSGIFNKSDLARRLGVEEFDRENSLSGKLNLPSSVDVQNRNETTDRIILRIKEDLDLESNSLLEFLREAYNAFPK